MSNKSIDDDEQTGTWFQLVKKKRYQERLNKKQRWDRAEPEEDIMGVTCNYFIALKIPELLVSVYRAGARQGHKLQPMLWHQMLNSHAHAWAFFQSGTKAKFENKTKG